MNIILSNFDGNTLSQNTPGTGRFGTEMFVVVSWLLIAKLKNYLPNVLLTYKSTSYKKSQADLTEIKIFVIK